MDSNQVGCWDFRIIHRGALTSTVCRPSGIHVDVSGLWHATPRSFNPTVGDGLLPTLETALHLKLLFLWDNRHLIVTFNAWFKGRFNWGDTVLTTSVDKLNEMALTVMNRIRRWTIRSMSTDHDFRYNCTTWTRFCVWVTLWFWKELGETHRFRLAKGNCWWLMVL